MKNLIISTASLYYWFEPYESHLEDRIHAALDCGVDGVEILNGPSILDWRPQPETVSRLHGKPVTVHAELYPDKGVTIRELTKFILSLPFPILNVVFHPDELDMSEFPKLTSLPFPVSLENMDASRSDWRTPHELKRFMAKGVGMTYDTAHAEENGMSWRYFAPYLNTPTEVHLSIPNDDYYTKWDYTTRHALTQFRPDAFPTVPSGCPIVTLEGLVPPEPDMLRREVEFVRERL